MEIAHKKYTKFGLFFKHPHTNTNLAIVHNKINGSAR